MYNICVKPTRLPVSEEERKRREEEGKMEGLKSAERRAAIARADIKRIKPVLEMLKQRNEKLEVLLPFEKKELLEKEIQLLELKHEVIYYKFAVEITNENNSEAKTYEEALVHLRDKVEEKKREYYNLFNEANKLQNKYNLSYQLHCDPRVKPYEEYTGDFRVRRRENRKAAFKYFPAGENRIEEALSNAGERYSEDYIREVDKVLEDLRSKMISSKKLLEDLI